jgi:hypothetical protein
MMDNLKQKLKPGKLLPFSCPKGQSLVEMAIATPLLLIMFIGVFEVGWALRGYIVLANVNRESARFAVKNTVLDFSERDTATVGYNTVLSHTTASLARQLPLDFLDNPNATIIMSHIVADTALPCVRYQGNRPVVPYEFDPACDCAEDDPNASQWFARDDLVLHPEMPGYEYYAQTYGISRTTRLAGGSYTALAEQLTLENNQFNCTVLKTGSAGELSVNNMFIAEAFYDQPQLFGMPFISNRLTDPIPFYTHTAMRIVASRDANTTDTIGPTCALLPITFPESLLQDPEDPPQQYIEAFEGSASGNFGWIYWDSDTNETQGINFIEESLANPRLAFNDFKVDEDDPDHPDDTSLNVDDWVAGRTGVGGSHDVDDLLEGYVGQTVYIPIYDDIGPVNGSRASYHVSHFAEVIIQEICLPNDDCDGVPNNEKAVRITFLKYVDDACVDGPVVPPDPDNNDPIAVDDTATVSRNGTVVINVLDNGDYDPDGDTITVATVTEITHPFHGTLEITDGGTTVTFQANNQTGSYLFEYTISDGRGGSDTANVTVTVTNP